MDSPNVCDASSDTGCRTPLMLLPHVKVSEGRLQCHLQCVGYIMCASVQHLIVIQQADVLVL